MTPLLVLGIVAVGAFLFAGNGTTAAPPPPASGAPPGPPLPPPPRDAPARFTQPGRSYEATIYPALQGFDEIEPLRRETGVEFAHADTSPNGQLSIIAFVAPPRPLDISPGAPFGATHSIVDSIEVGAA